MEIKEIGTTTYIISADIVISFGVSERDTDIVKVKVNSKLKYSIYQLADILEESKMGHCVYAEKETGIVLMYKLPEYDIVGMYALLSTYINTIEHE